MAHLSGKSGGKNLIQSLIYFVMKQSLKMILRPLTKERQRMKTHHQGPRLLHLRRKKKILPRGTYLKI
ncbi:alternative large t antigen [Rhinolophus simulator polyomavirus 2]|uniref:alternative large t antigen n=1 Tax=Rhinolophus simulator polyomavirus 2 TaxID=2029305 RepID=UPI000B620D07|nr:alternative large t antigen [Rhinolophus simulator polyomavirus 2]BAZ96593.1 alternative large t antigen [Rhinolophus simulator polyomavirus 2]